MLWTARPMGQIGASAPMSPLIVTMAKLASGTLKAVLSAALRVIVLVDEYKPTFVVLGNRQPSMTHYYVR